MPEGDRIRWPRNGEIGYYLAYPLMLASLAVLSLALLAVGIACELRGR